MKEAVSSLSGSRQRSLLALIGIVVGIGAVIAMIAVGMISKKEAAKQFQALGTDLLTIKNVSKDRDARRGAAATISLADALAVAALPDIEASAPYVNAPAKASLGGKTTARTQLVGVTQTFAELFGLDVEEGRGISDLDRRRYFCVIGSKLAAAMRAAGVRDVLGAPLRIDDIIYTVVGVLRSGVQGPRQIGMSHAALIPIATAQRVFGSPDIRRIVARTSPNAHHPAVAAEVSAYFARRSKDLVVKVDSPRRLIAQMHKQMRLFTLLLGSVGGVSLLLGGIGVMNVMLVSVTERRLEIGIRRALGARRRDIQWQFLIESMILSLLGGTIGIALGVAATYVICHFSNWPFQMPAIAVGLGVGVACAVGIFFGFYPAWRAARLDPIAALRGR